MPHAGGAVHQVLTHGVMLASPHARINIDGAVFELDIAAHLHALMAYYQPVFEALDKKELVVQGDQPLDTFGARLDAACQDADEIGKALSEQIRQGLLTQARKHMAAHDKNLQLNNIVSSIEPHYFTFPFVMGFVKHQAGHFDYVLLDPVDPSIVIDHQRKIRALVTV